MTLNSYPDIYKKIWSISQDRRYFFIFLGKLEIRVAGLFGRDAEKLAETIDFDCEKLVAKAVHNPTPLKKRVDEVIEWAASRP